MEEKEDTFEDILNEYTKLGGRPTPELTNRLKTLIKNTVVNDPCLSQIDLFGEEDESN